MMASSPVLFFCIFGIAGIIIAMVIVFSDDHKREIHQSEQKDIFWVHVGLMDGYSDRLSQIEKLLKARDTVNAEELFEEWKMRYAKYADLCFKLGRWNNQIHINKPYVRSQEQLGAEQLLFQRIEALYTDGIPVRAQFAQSQQAIFDHLSKQPYHCAYRTDMLKKLAGNDAALRVQLDSDYKYMIKSGILVEIREKSGKYVVHKASERSAKRTNLPASVYDPQRYANIERKTELKVMYTLAPPMNVDNEKNTAEYISVSRGDHYYTSLEKCTCPAYSKSYPCKHMVALANHLGFYKPGIDLIKIHEEAPIFDMPPEPDVVQTEPPSTKREDRETRQKTRNTNPDTTIEKPASTPKADQPQGTVSSDMTFDEFISMLKANNILFVDKTANNGCLWVECTKQTENLSTLSVDGIHPKKAGKTRHFNGQPGWYLDRK